MGKRILNKRGISIMIGYVLLVSFAMFISVVIYKQLKTYVPRESLECPDGVSLFVKDYSYDCSTSKLNITLKNNGRFSVGGYFIHAKNISNEEIATYDISDKIKPSSLYLNPGVLFDLIAGTQNSLDPEGERVHTFDLSTSSIGQVKSIEISPLRWQTIEERKRVVSCSNAKITETITCS